MQHLPLLIRHQVLPVGTWGLGLAPRAAGMAPPAVLAAAAAAAAAAAGTAAAAAAAAAAVAVAPTTALSWHLPHATTRCTYSCKI
jgi:hypothetical protein